MKKDKYVRPETEQLLISLERNFAGTGDDPGSGGGEFIPPEIEGEDE